MSDTCKHCMIRGNIVACRATPCHTHESWYAQQQGAEIERLREAIIRAPCSQNRIPCRWPCDNDPEDHGPCWKQAALANKEPPQP